MTSRVHLVLDALGHEICSGTLAPGSVVTAGEVQARMNTSRSGVREALSTLVSLGLLRVRRRVGYVVCPASSWQLLAPDVMRWRLRGAQAAAVLTNLTQLRALLEPAAAAQAASSASTEQRRAIAGFASQMLAAAINGDREEFVAADVRLHKEVLLASGNELYSALGSLLSEALPSRAPDAGSISLRDAQAHLDLAEAIARSVPSEAARLAQAIATSND